MENKIIIKNYQSVNEIIAGDNCFLRELLHPVNDQILINFSLAYAYILPNGKTIKHYLLQSETYYILAGEGIMYIDEVSFKVGTGTSYCVPPKCAQWIENKSDVKLEFLVIVDPYWRKENEYVLNGKEKIKGS